MPSEKHSLKPTAISLFAGAGGCSLGFQQAGFDVRFATDFDGDAVESYRRNFVGTPCEVADVRDLGAGNHIWDCTQGDALGFRMMPRWGRTQGDALGYAFVVLGHAVGLGLYPSPAMNRPFPAPTGHDAIAQGNALGIRP